MVDQEGVLEGCFGHKMCVVAHNRSHLALDSLGDIIGDKSVDIKNEGIYMFGGIYGQSTFERKVNDKLMFLPIGKDVHHKWRELRTTGKKPEGRFHHAMYFYEKGNYLIVLGGRRIADPAPPLIQNSEFVNSIWLLRVDSLEWHYVNCKQNEFPQLYNYSSSLSEDKIIIFGGMNNKYMYSSCLYSIDLEARRSKHGHIVVDRDSGA